MSIDLALPFLCQIHCFKIIPVAPRPLDRGAIGGGGNKTIGLGGNKAAGWAGRFLNSQWQLLGQDPPQLLGSPVLGCFWLFGTLVFLYSHQYSWFSKGLSLLESVFSFHLAQEGISAHQNLIPTMKPSLAVNW